MFVGVGDLEQFGLAEGLADQLEPHGERFSIHLGESAREADAADPGQIDGDGENVGEVHPQRVVAPVAHLEGGLGRGGADDGIHLLKGAGKVLPDQRADFLRAQVVGVVVAAA